FYIVHGVVVMLLLRFRQQSTPAFRMVVHSLDVLWPAVISAFATGEGNRFFLFFIFVLAAAAYRWGLWETLETAAAGVALLWIESLIVHQGLLASADAFLLRHKLPHLGLDIAGLEPKHLFMRSVYLLIMGLLLGYMAEQQKKLRAERVVIARVLGEARVETGLTGTIQQILSELLSMYAGQRALIASQETNSYRVFLGELRVSNRGPSSLSWVDTPPAEQQTYLYDSVADTFSAVRKGDSFEVLALDQRGTRVRNPPADFLVPLAQAQDFRSVTGVTFVFGQEWSGRIFLFDSLLTRIREDELRFLQELIRQVGPAVYNVYLVRRLRLRAGALERARFARELHDGAVQSLIAVEMQVDVLRRQSASASHSAPVTEELGRIQRLLREEVLKLRELMQQMKSFEVDAKRLLPFLADTVERFQRETGIAARFVSEASEIDMPARLCREIARIVQEGLVNIRKHSGASHVLVRVSRNEGKWCLTVEDDGRGFPFSGRLSQAELEAVGKGPLVIRERVRLIEGELTIESNPGQGARLEIRIPPTREAAYGH
ncbi:MAG TPA: histidine kinase, partial [Terriglobales bacterium]|nr:histidine kinase [Terriglobales bacterium]